MIPRTLSHFEILEPLGSGGMGMVYKARDASLNRLVAIKVLPADKMQDAERRARFIQEAQSTSALNHPNIVTIYEIGRDQDIDFMAMELIKGRTLDAVIPKRGMKVSEALKHAVQIADALAAAHSAGVIHRDIKPANMMVTETGLVKVLDFGLAKLVEPKTTPDAETRTIGAALTEKGVIMGSANYMSPEQAEAATVDARTDVFSLGAVMYEMLTGERAFKGETKMLVLSAILRDEPKPIADYSAGVPREIERLIIRCLRKDPARRFQHMEDLKVTLEELKEDTASGVSPVLSSQVRSRWPLAAVAVAIVVAAAAGAAWWWRKSAVGANEPVALKRMTFGGGYNVTPSISPDGKLIAYSSDRAGDTGLDIWLQQTAGGDAVRLTKLPFGESEPAFSPDGGKVVFCGHGEDEGLYVVSTLGGEPKKIAQGHRGQFSPDGSLIAYWNVVANKQHIYTIPVAGGAPKQLVPEFDQAFYPMWSADGKSILFDGAREAKGERKDRFDWFITPLEGGKTIRTNVAAELRKQKVVKENAFSSPAAWIRGRVVFTAAVGDNVNLWDIELDPKSGQPAGKAKRLTFGAGNESHPSVASDGTMVFSSGESNLDYWSLPLDANAGKLKGELKQLTNNSGGHASNRITSDGKRLAFCGKRAGNADVWMRDLDTGKETTLASSPDEEHLQGLSADGSVVTWNTSEGDRAGLYLSVSGGSPVQVCEKCNGYLGNSGNFVLYNSYTDPRDVMTFDRATGKAHPIPGTKDWWKSIRPSTGQQFQFAPRDNWILFATSGKGTAEAHLEAVPFESGRIDLARKVEVTSGQSRLLSTSWSPDGKLIYFLSSMDRNFCLYGQRFDPVKGVKEGEPFAVYHFHEPNRKQSASNVRIAEKLAVFAISESQSGIWVTRIPE